MSKLLFNKQPRLFDYDLACMIGDREAQFLQQIHYWLEVNREARRNFKEGVYWTFNSYENWQKQFPWLSVKQIKRVIGRLEEKELLIADNFNVLKIDRTKWYRINYEKLDAKYSGNGQVERCCPKVLKVPIVENIDSDAILDPETPIIATPERLAELQIIHGGYILSQPTKEEQYMQLNENIGAGGGASDYQKGVRGTGGNGKRIVK